MTSAIRTVLWPGIRDIVGDDAALAGITAYKTGYHAPRDWLRRNHPDDYSIQLAIDKLGPGDEGSAIDVTFKSAQGGDYHRIAHFSRRLYEAGQAKDPRAYPLREFQGNTDLDDDVEGWSFYRDHALTSSDKSHLWHIHESIHRKYINDAAAMRSILEIWDDMPSAKEIADELAGNSKFLNAVADAVLNRDGVPNAWGDATINPNVRLKSALVEIGNDANAIRAKLQA